MSHESKLQLSVTEKVVHLKYTVTPLSIYFIVIKNIIKKKAFSSVGNYLAGLSKP